MAKSAALMPKNDLMDVSIVDKNPVYKAVMREMRTLQNTVERPSGDWTLIKERSSATSGFNEKLK